MEPTNKLCAVCGEQMLGDKIVGRVHEGRLPNTPNRWRTIGYVHEKCEPKLEEVVKNYHESIRNTRDN